MMRHFLSLQGAPMAMIPEYTYVSHQPWTPLTGKRARLAHVPLDLTAEDALADALFSEGYRRLAQSAVGRCGVGFFFVWSQAAPRPAWPRYAIEIAQLGDPCVVWIETLPTLWDFLATYGMVGYAMQGSMPGDEADDEDDHVCPACQEALELDDDDTVWTCPHVREHDDA
jgi:hypothetical protein